MPRQLTDKTNTARLECSKRQDVQKLLKPLNDLLKADDRASKQKALGLTRQACFLRPKDGWCYLQAARALRANGFNERAVSALKKAEAYHCNGNVNLELVRGLQSAWRTCPIMSLPDELVVRIFSSLGFQDISRIQQTCKRLCHITQTYSELWRNAHIDVKVILARNRGVVNDPVERTLTQLLRRADGKLYTLDFLLALGHATWNGLLRWTDVSRWLALVDARSLTHLGLRLPVSDHVYDTAAMLQIQKSCRDAKRLESLEITSLLPLDHELLRPASIWPEERPPIKKLKLKGTLGRQEWYWTDWLVMTKSIIETMSITIREELSPAVENPPQDTPPVIRLPKLHSFHIEWSQSVRATAQPTVKFKLDLPVLNKLSYTGRARDPYLLGELLVPSLEVLKLSIQGDESEVLRRALPYMTNLHRIELGWEERFFDHDDIVMTLAENSQIPLRRIVIEMDHKSTGASLVRLCKSRLAENAVKISQIVLKNCEKILPEHAKWLREHVEYCCIGN